MMPAGAECSGDGTCGGLCWRCYKPIGDTVTCEDTESYKLRSFDASPATSCKSCEGLVKALEAIKHVTDITPSFKEVYQGYSNFVIGVVDEALSEPRENREAE